MCAAKLADLGFDRAAAQRATDAAGADVERAAALLLDNPNCSGLETVLVDK